MSDFAEQTKRATVLEYFQEMIDEAKRKTILSKEAKAELKKNEEYKKLLVAKKELLDKIKNIEENITQNIEIKKINTNVGLMKESVCDILDADKNIVSNLFRFYQKKMEKQVDDLSEISVLWTELDLN